MICGTITTKHILSHPLILVRVMGLVGYLRLLAKCLGSKPHCFTDFILK
ncbi:MAG: hypothetical protein V2A66_02295 [Pseudomonadota bacterium]